MLAYCSAVESVGLLWLELAIGFRPVGTDGVFVGGVNTCFVLHSLGFVLQQSTKACHLPLEKTTEMQPELPSDPLQAVARNQKHISLFLHPTVQPRGPRKSLPTGSLTQHTISEMGGGLISSFPPTLLLSPPCYLVVCSFGSKTQVSIKLYNRE